MGGPQQHGEVTMCQCFPQTARLLARKTWHAGNGDIVTYAGKARGRRHGRAAAREMGRCLRTPSVVLCCFAFLGWRLVSYSLPVPFAGSCQRPGEGTRDM